LPSRQDGEVPCAAAVCLSVGPVFPSPCGQRLDLCPGACGVTAVSVCLSAQRSADRSVQRLIRRRR
jgi:hypothetical protein